jgi:hypothetical protein
MPDEHDELRPPMVGGRGQVAIASDAAEVGGTKLRVVITQPEAPGRAPPSELESWAREKANHIRCAAMGFLDIRGESPQAVAAALVDIAEDIHEVARRLDPSITEAGRRRLRSAFRRALSG